jgi:integrase
MPLVPVVDLAEVFPGILDLAGRLAPRTLTEYRYDAQLYLAWCGDHGDEARDPASLRRWRTHLVAKGRAAATINRRLAAVRSLIKASVACDSIDYGIGYRFGLVERVQDGALKDRARPTTRMLLTRQQVRALCLAPDPTTLLGLRDRAFLAVLVGSGCRLMEAVTLRQEQMIPVKDGWNLDLWGKGQQRPRRALLSQDAYVCITRWLAARALYVDVPWMFTAFTGGKGRPLPRPLTRHGGYQIVLRSAKAAGLHVDHIHPHMLRRYVGTEVAAAYGVRSAQLTLGHQSLQTTVTYYVLDELGATWTDGLMRGA